MNDEKVKLKCFEKAIDIISDRSKIDSDRIIAEPEFETKIIKVTEMLIKAYDKVKVD